MVCASSRWCKWFARFVRASGGDDQLREKRSECSIWKAKLKRHYHSMRHGDSRWLEEPLLMRYLLRPPAFFPQSHHPHVGLGFCNPPCGIAIAPFLRRRVGSPWKSAHCDKVNKENNNSGAEQLVSVSCLLYRDFAGRYFNRGWLMAKGNV